MWSDKKSSFRTPQSESSHYHSDFTGMSDPDLGKSRFTTHSWLPRFLSAPAPSHNVRVEHDCLELRNRALDLLKSSATPADTELLRKTLTQLCESADKLIGARQLNKSEQLLEPYELFQQLKDKLSDLCRITSGDISAKRLRLILDGLEMMIQQISLARHNSPDNPNPPKQAT